MMWMMARMIMWMTKLTISIVLILSDKNLAKLQKVSIRKLTLNWMEWNGICICVCLFHAGSPNLKNNQTFHHFTKQVYLCV